MDLNLFFIKVSAAPDWGPRLRIRSDLICMFITVGPLRTLAYLRGTYDAGLTYCDPGPACRDVLYGWVDSDFAADPDTRRSMTGYIMALNGGPGERGDAETRRAYVRMCW